LNGQRVRDRSGIERTGWPARRSRAPASRGCRCAGGARRDAAGGAGM